MIGRPPSSTLFPSPPLSGSARSLKGGAPRGEEATVRGGGRAGVENEVEYRQLARLVAWAVRIPELVEVPPRPSAAELIAPGEIEPRVIPLPRFSRSGIGWLAAAAAAVVVVAGGFAYAQLPRHATAPPGS